MSKIPEYGGALCNLSDCDDICVYGCFCPCLVMASALHEGGSSCPWPLLVLLNVLPCYVPCGVTVQIDSLDTRIGGEPDFTLVCCETCCCYHFKSCQVARAVKDAKKQKVLGSPSSDAMER